MSIIIRIPDPETGELSRIELTADLQANFLDHDMAWDDMTTAMGGDESEFRRFLNWWQTNPIWTICSTNVIPLTKLGILSCEFVTHALLVHMASNEAALCSDQILQLVDLCRKQWGRRRYEFSRINHARQDLTSCWNKTVRERQRERLPMPGFGDATLVSLATDCVDFVTEFQQMVESKQGYRQPPDRPCEIAREARQVIAFNTLQGLYHYPNFREALNAQAPEIADEVHRIEFDQARLAIKVLEKLP